MAGQKRRRILPGDPTKVKTKGTRQVPDGVTETLKERHPGAGSFIIIDCRAHDRELQLRGIRVNSVLEKTGG